MKSKRIEKTIWLLTVLLIMNCVSVQQVSAADAVINNSLNISSLVLPIGKTYNLKLENEETVKWYSSDKNVVAVNSKGKIKAKALGNAAITAKTKNEKYKCKVTVKTLLIGHRGYSSQYPENTVVAVEEAFNNGFDGVEVDVWESENGDLMIHHDATTKRTTGKNKYIWKTNEKNRYKVPIINSNGIEEYEGQTILIPTLEEIAEIVSERKGFLLLHIKAKPDKGYRLSPKGASRIIKTISEYGLKSQTMIFSSDKKTILLFKNCGIKLGLSSNPERKNVKKVLKWCKKNGIKSQMFLTFENINVLGSLKKLTESARDYQVDVDLYTTETNAEFKSLSKSGVECALSDYKLSLS